MLYVCIWHVLVDQTFHGQQTNLHEQSQNGPELATHAWLVWFLVYTTRVNFSNIVMWVIQHNNAGWACSKTLIFAGSRRLIINIMRALVHFGSHALVPTSWMCKKQTSVSHSSTDAEIISVDASLRMDGDLDLWFFGYWSVAFFFQPTSEIQRDVQGHLLHDKTIQKTHQNQVKTPIQYNDLEFSKVDYVSQTWSFFLVLFYALHFWG